MVTEPVERTLFPVICKVPPAIVVAPEKELVLLLRTNIPVLSCLIPVKAHLSDLPCPLSSKKRINKYSSWTR